ncbi:MAG: hypothetical protein KF688_01325 [Pirellulales bacterium]|nr:hypothetical protein [Pirellulales bacterium]
MWLKLRTWLAEVDGLLRGESTAPELLAKTGDVSVSVRRTLGAIILLCMIYGLCMGSYSLLKATPPELAGGADRCWQLVASMVKTPLVFLLTLLVTFPSLYVLNALIGSRLRADGLCRLLTAAVAVNAAVLASLGPIVAFFSVSTNSHPFVVVMNVAMFSIAGFLGLAFLLQTLHRLTVLVESRVARDLPAKRVEASQSHFGPETAGQSPDDSPSDAASAALLEKKSLDSSPLEMPAGQSLAQRTRLIFRCWVVLFALVGAQMGWVMRPFIGSPDLPFTWFRERQSNFFTAVLHALGKLLFGE